MAPPVGLICRSGRCIIVVDAGRDLGAVAVTGMREKDVVLDVALRLRDALKSRGCCCVALPTNAASPTHASANPWPGAMAEAVDAYFAAPPPSRRA